MGCVIIKPFYDLDRYAVPPEHGQRLERMAKGKEPMSSCWGDCWSAHSFPWHLLL